MPRILVDMTLPVRVRTYELSDPDNIEQERVVDYATTEGRTWVSRHCSWALNNQRGVGMEPVL